MPLKRDKRRKTSPPLFVCVPLLGSDPSSKERTVSTAVVSVNSVKCLDHTHFIAALKADDIEQLKTRFGFDPKQKYVIPQEVTAAYAAIAKRGADLEQKWEKTLESYCSKYPNDHAELARRIKGDLPEGWEQKLPVYKPTDAAVASRKLSETVLTAITPVLPDLMGGSADLTGSNLTKVPKSVDFQPEATGLGTYKGIYIRYGVREHGMGAIMNGLSAYGGIIPFGGTFLVSLVSLFA